MSAPASAAPVPIPTLEDIRQGAEALRGVAIKTPMEESRWLSAVAGGPVEAVGTA